MALTFLVIGFLFLFVSCEQNCQQSPGGAQKSEATCPAPTTETSAETTTENSESEDVNESGAELFDASLVFTNFNQEDEDKVYSAISLIKKIIRTREFKDRVLNFIFNGKKQFNDNNGLTNQQIYDLILSGREELVPEIDHEMDLDLELYYSWKSTVGYTTPDRMRIYLNTKYFNTFTPLKLAGNLFHEWTHKLGFNHSSTYSVERDSSVPYALGYMIEELGKK